MEQKSQRAKIIREEETAILVQRNWLIGKRIAMECLNKNGKADYGKKTMKKSTLGIILCSDTDEDIAKYSVLHGHEQLFASKYKTYLPSEEQLREEIEIQKRFYYLQKKEDEELGENIENIV